MLCHSNSVIKGYEKKCANMSASFNNKWYVTHFCVIYTEILIPIKCFQLLFSTALHCYQD